MCHDVSESLRVALKLFFIEVKTSKRNFFQNCIYFSALSEPCGPDDMKPWWHLGSCLTHYSRLRRLFWPSGKSEPVSPKLSTTPSTEQSSAALIKKGISNTDDVPFKGAELMYANIKLAAGLWASDGGWHWSELYTEIIILMLLEISSHDCFFISLPVCCCRLKTNNSAASHG